MKLFSNLIVAFIALSVAVAGCAQQDNQNSDDSGTMSESQNEVAEAVAQLHSTDGNEILGTVTFLQSDEGVEVTANINGLEAGKHGFHIHQYGDCTAEDQTSAGGHYNPYNTEHGAPTDSERHMGDMGNLPINEEGYGNLTYTDNVIELNGPNSIIGRAVIIHGGADDFTSQPSGAAGPRLACGVIGIANPGQ